METIDEKDFDDWIEKQKQFLLNKDFENLDIEKLIDELDNMVSSPLSSLQSHLKILLTHLLKYNYQTTKLKDHWIEDKVIYTWIPSIENPRSEIEDLLDTHPHLKTVLSDTVILAYQKAKKDAVKQLNKYIRIKSKLLNDKSFPETCPWDFETIMDDDWLPEEII